MINLEKLNSKSVIPPLLKRPAPAPYFHLLFKIFQISRTILGDVIKTYFSHFKKGEGSLNYVSLHTSWLISLIIRKKPSQLSILS